jgi:adenylate cyclase
MGQRIAACLHADVSGYCRLIADDVEATVRTLKAYHNVMTRVVAEHDGRVVDTAGDSFLAEFASVTFAVRCGAYMQHELAALNAVLPPRAGCSSGSASTWAPSSPTTSASMATA